MSYSSSSTLVGLGAGFFLAPATSMQQPHHQSIARAKSPTPPSTPPTMPPMVEGDKPVLAAAVVVKVVLEVGKGPREGGGGREGLVLGEATLVAFT